MDGDQIPFPGECFRQTTKELMWENKLFKGELELGGRRVDLERHHVPFLNAMAQHDHIAPYESTNELTSLVGSEDKEDVLLKGGHVSLVAGANAIDAALAEAQRVARRCGRYERPEACATYPRRSRSDGTRHHACAAWARRDRQALLAFAPSLPEHDLLFLRTRHHEPRPWSTSWLDDIERGARHDRSRIATGRFWATGASTASSCAVVAARRRAARADRPERCAARASGGC